MNFKDCKNLTTTQPFPHEGDGCGAGSASRTAKTLTALNLGSTEVGDKGLEQIKRFTKLIIPLPDFRPKSPLRVLRISRKALPQCKIVWDGGRHQAEGEVTWSSAFTPL